MRKLYNETSILDIADAIREKNNTDNTYTVGQMANAIRSIETGGSSVIVDSSITQNSTNPVQGGAIYTALADKADVSKVGQIDNYPISSIEFYAGAGDFDGININYMDGNTEESFFIPNGDDFFDVLDAGGAFNSEYTVSGSTVTRALDPNRFYVFGTVSSLTITFNTDAYSTMKEYHFRFTSGSTPTTLTLPNSVTMPSGFQVEASKVYEISIVDNYGVYTAW